MSSQVFSIVLLGLLALFPIGIVLLVLLARPLLDGCRFQVMLLVWLLLALGLFRRLLKMVFVGKFTGLVVLDLGAKGFD